MKQITSTAQNVANMYVKCMQIKICGGMFCSEGRNFGEAISELWDRLADDWLDCTG